MGNLRAAVVGFVLALVFIGTAAAGRFEGAEMAQRTLTGEVRDAAGDLWADSELSIVQFRIVEGTWDATAHAPPDRTIATLSSGAYSVDLFAPATYEVTMPNGYVFELDVPDGGAATVEAVRASQETVPTVENILEDVLDARYAPGEVILVDGPTVTWDVTDGKMNLATVTLGGNRTLAITGLDAGASGILRVVQDATGGRTLELPAQSYVAGSGGGTITLSTDGGDVDILRFYSPSGGNMYWTFDLDFN